MDALRMVAVARTRTASTRLKIRPALAMPQG